MGKHNFWRIKNTKKPDHLRFSFKMNDLSDLLSFQFTLIDLNGKIIEFINNERKISILNFKVEVEQMNKWNEQIEDRSRPNQETIR